MKKGIKVIFIIIMLIGIVFSIFNFISVRVNGIIGGGDERGVWVYHGDYKECEGDGSQCDMIEM